MRSLTGGNGVLPEESLFSVVKCLAGFLTGGNDVLPEKGLARFLTGGK